MTDVHGRTFGVWTLLSCTLCFLCAFNLGNRPLYVATLLSFVYAYAHFILEYLVYHTFTAANLGSFALVAGTRPTTVLCTTTPSVHTSWEDDDRPIVWICCCCYCSDVDRLDVAAVELPCSPCGCQAGLRS